MPLRQRVKAAKASAKLHFGKRNDDPDSVNFWVCHDLTKVHIQSHKDEPMEAILEVMDLESKLKDITIHFVNESTGMVIPRGDELGKYVNDRDVVRICTEDELAKILESFAGNDSKLTISPKSNSSISNAIWKFTKGLGQYDNPTLNKLQRTLEEMQGMSPTAEQGKQEDNIFQDMDSIFETDEVEEIQQTEKSGHINCDICEVSWPDDMTSKMYRFKSCGIITHHSCTQFAADVLAQNPNIQTRDEFLKRQQAQTNVNQPGSFHVTVYRAMELPSTSFLGSNKPYAKLTLLPWKEPAQTKPCETSGRNPVWNAGVHDNAMTFSHMYNSSITPIPLLEVEIWNANYLSDDQVACTLLDMTPLLRYPNIQVKRWFTLSSRAQTSATALAQSTGQPKIQLSIQFIPHDGPLNTGHDHKFRVHQLRSVGLAIPHCAVCDRVIVNVLKKVWGYRCEHCGVDVHKACLMKAMNSVTCERRNYLSSANGGEMLERETKQVTLTHGNLAYKLVNSNADHVVGHVYVNFKGLHLCSKRCDEEKNFHVKNVFEGDTYCRIQFYDSINSVYETSPVLKTADPMCMEKIVFAVTQHDASIKIEVIDFNTEAVLGELTVTMFQLLQRKADKWIDTNPTLQSLKDIPYVHDLLLDPIDDDAIQALPKLSDKEWYAIYSGTSSSSNSNSNTNGNSSSHKTSKDKEMGKVRYKVGQAIVEFDFVESMSGLIRVREGEEVASLLAREDKDFSIETLKITIERVKNVFRIIKWIDTEYGEIIGWENPPKSAFALGLFVTACIFVDLEHLGMYLCLCLLMYMMYTLAQRIHGLFYKKWIGYSDYQAAEADRLKLHRPIANLYVAVQEARIREITDTLLQDILSSGWRDSIDVAFSSVSYFVRIKYLPNDRNVPSTRHTKTVYVPSEYESTVVANTFIVEKSMTPIWRNISSDELSKQSSHLPPSVLQLRKDEPAPFRNFNVSWLHDASLCSCSRCKEVRERQVLADKSSQKNDTETAEPTPGIDHHAFYFPIPQARRKNLTGREDLASWKVFPGLLQFDLCVTTSGEVKDNPDIVLGTGFISLRECLEATRDEFVLQLDTSTLVSQEPISIKSIKSTLVEEGDNVDCLTVRLALELPNETQQKSAGSIIANSSFMNQTMRKAKVSRAERSVSEFVCESLAKEEKEKQSSSPVIGSGIFDALNKIKDILKSVQNELARICGAIACTKNLLNWTHPWKTAALFVVVFIGMLIFARIPGRWLVLCGGLSEFAAVFLKDMPPSNYFRKVLSNVISSLPTEQDLINVYEFEHEKYRKTNHLQEVEKQEYRTLLLKQHALWGGYITCKAEGDRHFRTWYMIYRPYRLIFWKARDDLDTVGSNPSMQLLFDHVGSVIVKSDDSDLTLKPSFQVVGTNHNGVEEKRIICFDTDDDKVALLRIIQDSFTSSGLKNRVTKRNVVKLD